MSQSELALAVSVRSWPDELHRFLVDHGGARVRLTAMSPDDLSTESFDVLLIDDVCSFLSPGLVASVERKGASVLGVHDPHEYPDGRRRLLDCGVTGVIEAHAHPDEFLEAVSRITAFPGHGPSAKPAAVEREALAPLIAVAGAAGGVGTTEIAAALARRMSRRTRTVALLDLDFARASMAQRFDLAPHPNLLTAIDAVERGQDITAMQGHGEISVLAGRPGEAHLGGLRAHQVTSLLDLLRSSGGPVVLDLGDGAGSPSRLPGALDSAADHLVLVGEGSPVGLARLIGRASAMPHPAHLVVNRAPADSFRRGEIIGEIRSALPVRSLALVPYDRNVAVAAWAGRPVATGRFVRAVNRWVDTFLAGSPG